MTYSETINNSNLFIFSICASPATLLLNMGHGGVQNLTHLFISLFLPRIYMAGFSQQLYTKVRITPVVPKIKHFWRPASSVSVVSPWLGIQKIIYIFLQRIFPDMSVKLCLQEYSNSRGHQWPVIQTCMVSKKKNQMFPSRSFHKP